MAAPKWLTSAALEGTRDGWRRAWDGEPAQRWELAAMALVDAIEERTPGESGVLVA